MPSCLRPPLVIDIRRGTRIFWIMADEIVRFVVQLAVKPGKFEAFDSIIKTMAAETQKEPGALGYKFYLSPDRSRCHLIESYRNIEAVQAHMSGPVVRDFVPKLLEAATLSNFEVYGDPGAEAANVLAGLGATIYSASHGFNC